MTTTTVIHSAESASLATSTKFRNFAIVFGVAVPLIYVCCEWFNLPLFTYHPATNRVDLFWAAARSGEGPAMYWYGWTATSLVVGFIVGMIGTALPDSVIKKIPLILVWLLPILVF